MKKYNIVQNYWFQCVLLMAFFIFAYWIPLENIVKIWSTNEDYSYGFLIPVISAYLFWDMRSKFHDIRIAGSWYVLPILVFFILVSLYGVLGSSGNVSQPAIPILIILFFCFCFSVGAFKKFMLPLCFLFFMIPLPAVLDRTIGVFLKSVSSKMGGELIRLFGLSVNIQGNVIDLGVTQLQVVDACSGLRFVFPLVALGVVYAYFFEKVRWKQIYTVLSTVPIAILTNTIRIGITGLLTFHYGPKMAQGFFHDFSGWLIFMVAFVFLFIQGRILRFFPPKPGQIKEKAVDKRPAGFPLQLKATNNLGAVGLSVILLLTVTVLTLNTSALPPIKIKGGIESFPIVFSDWKGRAELVDPEIVEESGAEESFRGGYVDRHGDYVSLYMGYRSTAFLENENYFHSPTVCLPSSGWKILQIKTHKIPDITLFGSIEVTKMVAETMDQRHLVYFWFQTKDKATYDKNINRLHLALHAIKRDNTHALFIRPITQIMKGEKIEDAEKRMDGFVREMMPTLVSFLNENQFEEK